MKVLPKIIALLLVLGLITLFISDYNSRAASPAFKAFMATAPAFKRSDIKHDVFECGRNLQAEQTYPEFDIFICVRFKDGQ